MSKSLDILHAEGLNLEAIAAILNGQPIRQASRERKEDESPILCTVPGCGFYANDDSDFCPSHY